MRRVVGIVGDMVCYSDGSNKNRFCKVATFQKWAAKPVVEKVH